VIERIFPLARSRSGGPQGPQPGTATAYGKVASRAPGPPKCRLRAVSGSKRLGRLIAGHDQFFGVTKSVNNAMQGPIRGTQGDAEEKKIYSRRSRQRVLMFDEHLLRHRASIPNPRARSWRFLRDRLGSKRRTRSGSWRAIIDLTDANPKVLEFSGRSSREFVRASGWTMPRVSCPRLEMGRGAGATCIDRVGKNLACVAVRQALTRQ